ncbi:universal stress protein [Ovoidimarina sediminis]|uniref:universal stress protein n=1 Tax=Ovoidimarina sediminis TaxID=3079856 RepID=UPI00290B0281|nr:universal stress protein [Rhodophyticola sp. MJ-SS7]MDU8945803.1 universal stress protein [Rhodophyticola sp. MJ-SS7]
MGKTGDPTTLRGLAAVWREHAIHISLLVLGAMPRIPVYSYGIAPYGAIDIPDNWHEELERNANELAAVADAHADMLAKEGVEADVKVLCAELRGLRDGIARRALSTDFVVLASDLRTEDDLFNEALTAAIFDSPAGVLVNAFGEFAALAPKRVFVAWNDGLQASRAVRAALPALKEAEEVTLALFDPVMTAYGDGENPGSDIARWLTHHGCSVSVKQFPAGGLEIGDAIKMRATECDADLIVMGAYHHARMQQIVFGGTTRTMIKQTDKPVLLAH